MPKLRIRWTFLLGFLLLLIFTNVSASVRLQQKPLMSDSSGNAIADNGLNAGGGLMATADTLNIFSIRPPSVLAALTIRKYMNKARALLTVGETFRQTELQLPPSCSTPEECQLNYQNLNNGELFFSFCSDYDSVDVRGYCTRDNPSTWPNPDSQIRGQLIRARKMFGLPWPSQPMSRFWSTDS
ncbi:hypothetical protein KFU94_50755 [Chloroflexi bacterium TSY]|nr:hypothetical protein [Chloroflexi bacterium TSY]